MVFPFALQAVGLRFDGELGDIIAVKLFLFGDLQLSSPEFQFFFLVFQEELDQVYGQPLIVVLDRRAHV